MADPAGKVGLRVPGRIIKDPSDLSIAAPYGGTYLGLVEAVALMTFAPVEPIQRPAYGPAEWADAVELGYRFELRAALRVWDDDMFHTMFTVTAVGAGGRRGLSWPASGVLPGTLLSDRAFSLLFAPDEASAPSVYFRSALPVAAQPMETPLSAADEALWRVRFVARRDPSVPTGSVQWQLLEDVTL